MFQQLKAQTGFIGLLLILFASLVNAQETDQKRAVFDTKTPCYDSVFNVLLAKYRSTSQAPGSLIGYKKNNESPWINAVGLSDKKIAAAIDSNTLFRCGSITKVFTAVIVLQLVQEGKLHLNDTVTKILPELQHKIKGSEYITITQLLNHTSGLSHPTADGFFYRLKLAICPKSMSALTYKDRLKKYVYRHPLRLIPGTSSYYSNAGYWILGLMIEKLNQKTVDQVFQERIFDPIGLQESYLTRPINASTSCGYNFIGNRMVDVSKWDNAECEGDPSAGLLSSANDLLLFSEALFGGKLITEALLNEMLTFDQPSFAPKSEFGLGIEMYNTSQLKGFGKNGTSLGFDANLIYFPDYKSSLVIFSNYGGGNDKSIIDEFIINGCDN